MDSKDYSQIPSTPSRVTPTTPSQTPHSPTQHDHMPAYGTSTPNHSSTTPIRPHCISPIDQHVDTPSPQSSNREADEISRSAEKFMRSASDSLPVDTPTRSTVNLIDCDELDSAFPSQSIQTTMSETYDGSQWHGYSTCEQGTNGESVTDVNYHEAAIFVREGENNDKFTAHPTNLSELPAYLMTHSTWFYMLDLFASVLIMLLAVIEKPAVPYFQVQIWVHASLELFCLMLIGLELLMKLKWLGVRSYVTHIRTMFKTIVLLEMIGEAFVMLILQTPHFRIARALRPIFILDSYYCRGTRRFMRQILLSLPPIIDMLLLLFFFMIIFTLLGFHLFSGVEDDIYFQTIEDSFLSLFILLTTANFPDVMMPAYNKNRFACLFFISYLVVELYFLMNLFLAVVYNSFSMMEKEKLKRLLLHKREACERCFKLLRDKQDPYVMTLKDFFGLMKYYQPRANKLDIYLTYKALDQQSCGKLNIADFYNFYEIVHLKWKMKSETKDWYLNLWFPLVKYFKCLKRLVEWYWFDAFIYFVLFVNLLWLCVDTLMLSVAMSRSQQVDLIDHEFKSIGISVTFTTIYVVEIVIKLLALGPREYLKSGWNLFDFCTIMASVAGLTLEFIDNNFYYLLVIRPLRLLRLFKLKRRLQDILATMSLLFSRMLSIGIVMILLYYTFAIVGMEIFSAYDLRNCCTNTTVQNYYENHQHDTGNALYYYINNFDNIVISYVTLFELTVVNNWYVIMDGYAVVATEWSRIYFITFYLFTMVVLTVVVAFILEAFLFRIKYRQSMHGHDMKDDALFKIDVPVYQKELRIIQKYPIGDMFTKLDLLKFEETPECQDMVWYEGQRYRTKHDFSIKMYKEELTEWINEESARTHRSANRQRSYGAIE